MKRRIRRTRCSLYAVELTPFLGANTNHGLFLSQRTTPKPLSLIAISRSLSYRVLKRFSSARLLGLLPRLIVNKFLHHCTLLPRLHSEITSPASRTQLPHYASLLVSERELGARVCVFLISVLKIHDGPVDQRKLLRDLVLNI